MGACIDVTAAVYMIETYHDVTKMNKGYLPVIKEKVVYKSSERTLLSYNQLTKGKNPIY